MTRNLMMAPSPVFSAVGFQQVRAENLVDPPLRSSWKLSRLGAMPFSVQVRYGLRKYLGMLYAGDQGFVGYLHLTAMKAVRVPTVEQ
jgi:hypothetical protein